MVLVEVEAECGLVGRGESWINYPSWAAHERMATLTHGVRPLVVGHDARNTNAIHDELTRALGPLGRQWGAPGPIMQAISGLDIAVWDLHARLLGVSVSELLGGSVRDRIPVYASSLGPDDVAKTASECMERGFDWIKVKVGFGADIDRCNLRTCREIVGDDVTIVADANQAWSLAEAIQASSMLRESEIAWIEEPIGGDDVDDLQRFTDATGIPTASGENVYGLADFVPRLATDGIAVHQPDVAKTGGITEVARICAAAQSLGKSVMPHLYGGAFAFAASLQLAASFGAIKRLEYDIRSNPLRDPLIQSGPKPAGGSIAIPRGPGLGLEYDGEAIAQYEIVSP